MRTLAEIETLVILHRLKEFGFNYTKTAKSLGISYRGFTIKLKKIKKNFPEDFEESFLKRAMERKPEEYIWKGMPSNEERLKYLDG